MRGSVTCCYVFLAKFLNFKAVLRETPRFLLLENCVVTKRQCKPHIFIFVNKLCAWSSQNSVMNVGPSEKFRNVWNAK